MDVLDDVGFHPADRTGGCEAKNCGAAAYVFAEVNGTELAYCGHHGTEYLPKLMQQGTVIADLRDLIPR